MLEKKEKKQKKKEKEEEKEKVKEKKKKLVIQGSHMVSGIRCPAWSD